MLSQVPKPEYLLGCSRLKEVCKHSLVGGLPQRQVMGQGTLQSLLTFENAARMSAFLESSGSAHPALQEGHPWGCVTGGARTPLLLPSPCTYSRAARACTRVGALVLTCTERRPGQTRGLPGRPAVQAALTGSARPRQGRAAAAGAPAARQAPLHA